MELLLYPHQFSFFSIEQFETSLTGHPQESRSLPSSCEAAVSSRGCYLARNCNYWMTGAPHRRRPMTLKRPVQDVHGEAPRESR